MLHPGHESKDELRVLTEIIQGQLRSARHEKGENLNSIIEGLRWNLSMLQKMEGTFELVYDEPLSISEPLIEEYLEIKKLLGI